MEAVKQKLTVGTPNKGLNLYCNVKLNGKTVRRFRSKSFVGAFGSVIQSRMHGGDDWRIGFQDIYSSSYDNWLFNSQHDIESHQTTNPARVSVDSPYLSANFQDYDAENPSYIIIANYGDFNGCYYAKKIDNNTFDLYDFDGNPIDGTGFSAPTTTGYMQAEVGWTKYPPFADDPDVNWQGTVGCEWDMIVGRSDKAVDVRDAYLHDRIVPGSSDGTLSHGSVNVSAQTTDKPTSKFVLTKSFTNQGSTTVEVKELGIVMQVNKTGNDANQLGMTMVRDTLGSPLSVPAGKTLTVDYEVLVRLTPDTQDTDTDGTNGGFLANFVDYIRDMATNKGYNMREVGQLATLPGTAFIGQSQQHDDTNESSNTSPLGLRLGTVNKYVSMTDNSLDPDNAGAGIISHGEADGELYHYGTDVTPIKYDTVNNKATYRIERIFENRGSTTVTVKEIGLYALSNGLGNELIQKDNAIIARTALDSNDQFTIAAGAYKKVIYEVEVIA
jgi:hypothetical protein